MNLLAVLDNIPDYVNPLQKVVTIEDCIGLHNSFTAEMVEPWIIYKAARPDLSAEDVATIDKIIIKLHALANYAIRDEIATWRDDKTEKGQLRKTVI